MTARTSEEASEGLSVPAVHRCHGLLQKATSSNNNGTCAEQLSSIFPPFSSTLALLVLVAVLVGIVLVSLATFHFHKRKLRNRKIQRAQEEYERDSRSPARAAGGGEPARPCVIVRPPPPPPVKICEQKPPCQDVTEAAAEEEEEDRALHETVPLDC